MAEQVMDMVDMMQTPKGQQDLAGFNWGGEDLEGPAGSDQNGRASSGLCGLLKGVLGGGLDDGAKGNPQTTGVIGAGSDVEASSSPRVRGSRVSQSSAGANSSQLQPPTTGKPQESVPEVQRSQSPDMRNMGLRHSIQATKLVMAQSRSSGILRQSSTPEVRVGVAGEEVSSKSSSGAPRASSSGNAVGSKRKAAAGNSATFSREGIKSASPSRSLRSSTGKGLTGALGSARSSSNGGSEGSKGANVAAAEGNSSMRSSRNGSAVTSTEQAMRSE